MEISREEKWILDEKYGGEKTEGFFADCTRLASGEPLAYIIGHIPFGSVQIFLDSRPLIPRPETEYWVSTCIQQYQTHTTPLHILDLCAGSGCIGVYMADKLPLSTIDFVEIDIAHHETIKKNCTVNTIDKKRYRVFGGSLFENITDQYDLIVTNPPYIDPCADMSEKSVHQFEPHLALYGGKDGLSVVLSIIESMPHFLTQNGELVIEHEPSHVDAIHTHASLLGYTALSYEDQFMVKRFTRISKKHM